MTKKELEIEVKRLKRSLEEAEKTIDVRTTSLEIALKDSALWESRAFTEAKLAQNHKMVSDHYQTLYNNRIRLDTVVMKATNAYVRAIDNILALSPVKIKWCISCGKAAIHEHGNSGRSICEECINEMHNPWK